MLRTASIPVLLVTTLLLASTAASAQAQDSDDAFVGPQLACIRHIVLDPGHGGSNHGAVGVAGVYERFLTLDTARRLRERLLSEFEGLEVTLTRDRDVDMGLGERTAFANAAEPDLFISLHYNAAESDAANGIEVWYVSTDDVDLVGQEPLDGLQGPSDITVYAIVNDLRRSDLHRRSALLADVLLPSLVESTGGADRGVRQAHFRVLRGALMPAVVVEMGFLTHSEEGARLLEAEYTEALVEGLLDGIVAYDALVAQERW